MDKLRIGVVFGGRSVEHDVSIVTAHQVMGVLSGRHEVVPIYITREGKWLSAPDLFDLDVYKNRRWDQVGHEAFIPPVAGFGGLHVIGGRVRKPRRVELDVVVPAIHGTYGEDGTLQGLLDLADIPYTGAGTVGSAVGMDKVAMKAAFVAAGLHVVDHVLVETRGLDADPDGTGDLIEKEIGYPVFVKPARLGSSVGIGKAVDRSSLVEALEVARRYDRRILVERSMEGCIEVNCSVLGGPDEAPRSSVCEQPVAWEEFLTFEDKYLRSGKSSSKVGAGMAGSERRIPAPISDELTEQVRAGAVTAFKAVDAAGVARVDSFVDEDAGESWVMEINTCPGSFSFYLWEASGMSFGELLDELILIAQRGHKLRSELLFSFDSGMLGADLGGKSGGG
jgi:D-alanine-D-alanine ligase